MAIDYFIGWSRQDLETELRAAQEDLAAGKDTTAAGAGDAHIQSRIEISPMSRIQMILLKLNALAPTDYPLANITPTRIVKVAFSTPTQLVNTPS